MSDTFFPNRPAITREADDPEMEQWAYEATAALEAASVGGIAYLARMKDAGEFLSKAKKKCKHGNWIQWLNRHNINRVTAFRAIKAYSKCFTVKHLEDAVEEIAEKGQEEEITAPPLPDQSKVYCSRNCRVGLGPSKCKACKKARAEEARKAAEEAKAKQEAMTPEQRKALRLKDILDRGLAHQRLAERLVSFSKRIREVERWEIYRKVSGDHSETYAEALLKASKIIASTAPTKACDLCKGEIDPNPDSEPCTDCGGKGVLTAAEVQAIKERLDF